MSFCDLPMLDDAGRQGVERGEAFEHVLVGARAGLCPLEHGELELLEQDAAKLDGRVDIELGPRLGVNLAHQAAPGGA